MSTTELQAVHDEVGKAVSVLVKADPLRKATDALKATQGEAALVVQSDDDAARVGDLRLALRKGVRHVETGITDLFRPRKMFEKLLREHFTTTYVQPMEAAVRVCDHNLAAWDTEKKRREREEVERIQREAEEAAAAAKAEAERLAAEAEALRQQATEAACKGEDPEALLAQAAALDAEADDAPPEGPAQVFVPEVINEPIRGAEATTYFVRKTVATMEDLREALRMWPDAFTFNPAACAKLYDTDNKQPEDGTHVLLGGVRFTVEVSTRGRAR